MASYQTSPSHYMNQCWLQIIGIDPQSYFIENALDMLAVNNNSKFIFEYGFVSARGQYFKPCNSKW